MDGSLLNKEKKQNKRPELRLIQGGKRSALLIGSIKIVVATEKNQPFEVGAIASEEDTYLVLSADKKVSEPKEHPIRLLNNIQKIKPATPGSVIVKGKYPYKLLAVVYDLNLEPSWKEEWIAGALDGIFKETEKRRVQSLALPMVGTLHGSLDKKQFAAFLKDILKKADTRFLKRIWLIVPKESKREIIQLLEQ